MSIFPINLPVLVKRTLDPRDPNPCRGCSDCCEYVAVPLARPRARKDYDELFWFLLHRNVWIFIDEDDDWFIQFNTPCLQLRDQRCGIYDRRPVLCRDYAVADCTTYAPGSGQKTLFTRPDEFAAWVQKHRPKTYARLQSYYGGAWPVPRGDLPRAWASAG
ncbi:MAG: YkgJ family cysteine cluster protein [Phycisphaerae bacterium]